MEENKNGVNTLEKCTGTFQTLFITLDYLFNKTYKENPCTLKKIQDFGKEKYHVMLNTHTIGNQLKELYNFDKEYESFPYRINLVDNTKQSRYYVEKNKLDKKELNVIFEALNNYLKIPKSEMDNLIKKLVKDFLSNDDKIIAEEINKKYSTVRNFESELVKDNYQKLALDNIKYCHLTIKLNPIVIKDFKLNPQFQDYDFTNKLIRCSYYKSDEINGKMAAYFVDLKGRLFTIYYDLFEIIAIEEEHVDKRTESNVLAKELYNKKHTQTIDEYLNEIHVSFNSKADDITFYVRKDSYDNIKASFEKFFKMSFDSIKKTTYMNNKLCYYYECHTYVDIFAFGEWADNLNILSHIVIDDKILNIKLIMTMFYNFKNLFNNKDLNGKKVFIEEFIYFVSNINKCNSDFNFLFNEGMSKEFDKYLRHLNKDQREQLIEHIAKINE